MGKIICDVCGTSYQESAMQCPICGCVRPVDVAVERDTSETKIGRNETYTYVKGGRFSKANVQKRNQGILRENTNETVPVNTAHQQKSNKNDKGLVIAVCALLVAIIAVVIYIVLHFFAPVGDPVGTQPDLQTTTTAETTAEPTVENIPCTEIIISDAEVTLTSMGAAHALNVSLTPLDTTDDLLFASEDESVATVSENGEIVAVAAGETVVTVTCGDVRAQCRVVCSFDEEESTSPSTEPTDEDIEFKAPFKINKTDVSISVGETFLLKLVDANGEIVPVTWSPTIADICTIEGNTVTGAAKGKIELSTTYSGETYTCIVRVR